MTNDDDGSTTPLLFGLPTPTPHLQSIQVIQNAALRVATGCHASTPVEHLHHEMMDLPVSHHMHMLGAQFLASALCPSDPFHSIFTADPGSRRMKETHLTRYRDVVAPFLNNGVMEVSA